MKVGRKHIFHYSLHNSLSSGDTFQLFIISDYSILTVNLHRKLTHHNIWTHPYRSLRMILMKFIQCVYVAFDLMYLL